MCYYEENKENEVLSMKLKDGFLLRQVAGEHVVLPIGPELEQNIMITLNGTGAFLWERLQSETDEDALVAALLETYEVQEPLARQCVQDFVKKVSSVPLRMFKYALVSSLLFVGIEQLHSAKSTKTS